MAFTTGLQLSIELSQIFGAARQALSAGRNLIDFSRHLRNSGSDIVVEEDLADVFGRMRIAHPLELDFKKKVLANTSITPLHGNSDIQLHAGAGPTVDRAFRDNDRRYLSTVIQLSMFCWIHDRADLASAISECLGQRVNMSIGGANPSPGLEGILATLEACASQTNQYAWNAHFEQVRYKIWQTFPRTQFPSLYQGNALDALPAEILLSAMDCMCLVQSLPEDRIFFIPTRRGMIPLIVWAHDLLGLTVQVECRGRTTSFGAGSPQVIIHPHEEEALEQTIKDIALLDKSMDIVFTYVPEDTFTQRLQKQERHPIRGIALEILRRHFNWYFTTEEDSSLYEETAQVVVEFAMIKSLAVRRDNDYCSPSWQRSQGLEKWRILDAAKVVFDGVHLSGSEIDAGVRSHLANTTPLLSGIRFSPALVQFAKRMADLKNDGRYALKYWDDWSRKRLECDMKHLAVLILILGHVKEIQACASLPILMDFSKDSLIFKVISRCGTVFLDAETIFYEIAGIVIGPSFKADTHKDCFLISDFGWSIHLSCCEDSDPADIRPELVCIRHGVPTNAKTGERKRVMMDFPSRRCTADSFRVFDRNTPVYKPRCEMPVSGRTEFFSSRIGAFLLSIQFEVEAVLSQFSGQQTKFYIATSYRRLHNALWGVSLTSQHIQCPHEPHFSSSHPIEAALSPGAVTVAGYQGGATDRVSADHHTVPDESCFIVLVAGDPRARWLSVEEAWLYRQNRHVMLRSDDCCEKCALAFLQDVGGKWILVL